MYFPYFRGRQYELLALRELAQENLLGMSVIPVVEPIKRTPTFDGMLQSFENAKTRLAIIFNPEVGNFVDNGEIIDVYHQKHEIIEPALLMNKDSANVLQNLLDNGVAKSIITAIIDKRDSLDIYKAYFTDVSPQFTLFPDERQIRRTVTQGRVMFEDKFKKQDRNADYPEDEFFSEDHIYFKEEGYVGFGDYSIIGNEYTERGFAPYAVAIHIVYFADDNTLRVHHFISDSNRDISDVAGKFGEAVTKLETWYNNGQQRQLTMALSILLNYAETGYYPGLPTIKKLSIMHHLELVAKYLNGGVK
jgi:hypothetical protein